MRAAPVAAARALHRRTERVAAGRFLAEGPAVVSEAMGAHARGTHHVVEVFSTANAARRHPDVPAAARALAVPVHEVSDTVADALASTRTPQGLVAVCEIPSVDLSTALAGSPRLVAVLVDVADPGNAGTAIRTADAAGADLVILAGSAVDAYNGKCVRATAGSLFHLPVVAGVTVDDTIRMLRDAGVRVVAADVTGEDDLDSPTVAAQLARPTGWLFGNEAHGLESALLAGADQRVRIPIYGRAESLNLAAAVAVCLYASARIRRASG